MRILRWTIFAITTLWVAYMLARQIAQIVAFFGVDTGLPINTDIDNLDDPSVLVLHVINFMAITGYALAALFIFRGKALALPAFGVALVLDFGLWIYASAMVASYELTSVLHTSVINWIFNLVLLSVLIGVYMLRSAGELK